MLSIRKSPRQLIQVIFAFKFKSIKQIIFSYSFTQLENADDEVVMEMVEAIIDNNNNKQNEQIELSRNTHEVKMSNDMKMVEEEEGKISREVPRNRGKKIQIYLTREREKILQKSVRLANCEHRMNKIPLQIFK